MQCYLRISSHFLQIRIRQVHSAALEFSTFGFQGGRRVCHDSHPRHPRSLASPRPATPVGSARLRCPRGRCAALRLERCRGAGPESRQLLPLSGPESRQRRLQSCAQLSPSSAAHGVLRAARLRPVRCLVCWGRSLPWVDNCRPVACFASSSLLATLACVVKPLRAIVQQLPGGLYSTVFRFWWWAAAITASRCPCAFCVGVAFISAATAQRSRVRQRLRPAKRLRPAQAFGGIALCSDSDSALLHSRPIAGVPGGPCAAAAGRARRDRVPKLSRAI